MSKPLKTRSLKAEMLHWVHVVGGISIVALFGFTAAIFAASAVQADSLLPANDVPPTTPAVYPEYVIAPRPPHLQVVSEQLGSGTLHKSIWFHGIASWYGPSFNGRLTADGEVYNMYDMTAATTEFHPKLPLGTKVRVVNSKNGRSVIVRITDRGPLPKGRVIDLSYGAARKLAMVKPGIAYVRVDVLRWGRDNYRSHAE